MKVPKTPHVLIAGILLLALPSRAQEIASKDLLRPAVETPATEEKQEKNENPNGCEELKVGGYVDGVSGGLDKPPRKFQIGLVKISARTLEAGREITATVKLQNGGDESVQIPWSTDFETTRDGQDPSSRQWEVGLFQIWLRFKQRDWNRLKTTSLPLYSSKFISGSKLTLKRGEWITAQISFLVEVQRPEFEEIIDGPAELAVEWFQTTRTWVVKDCAVRLGYFPYDGFYSRSNRVIVSRVGVKRPDKGEKQSPQPK